LEYVIEIWDILWPFGTFCIRLVHFSGFGLMCQTNLATLLHPRRKLTSALRRSSHEIPRLPDFSWSNKPKWEKYTKRPQNIPSGRKIYPLAVK
jgi:hypothetical protein